MLIDRRYLLYFDWISFGLTCAIAALGLAFIYSSTTLEAVPYSIYFKKQLAVISNLTNFLAFFQFLDDKFECGSMLIRIHSPPTKN